MIVGKPTAFEEILKVSMVWCEYKLEDVIGERSQLTANFFHLSWCHKRAVKLLSTSGFGFAFFSTQLNWVICAATEKLFEEIHLCFSRSGGDWSLFFARNLHDNDFHFLFKRAEKYCDSMDRLLSFTHILTFNYIRSSYLATDDASMFTWLSLNRPDIWLFAKVPFFVFSFQVRRRKPIIEIRRFTESRARSAITSRRHDCEKANKRWEISRV